MSKPLISIIIPVLNGIKFLDRCFSTLKKQTYPNLEIIFVDNGSSDGSREKLNQYCSKDNNYYLLDCSMPGPGIARNKGIEFSNGEYISFLDVDDELEPNKHTVLLDIFNNYPEAAMAIGQTKKVYFDGKELAVNLGLLKVGFNHSPTPGLLWLQQFQHNPPTCSYLLRKKIIIENSICFPELQYGEDIAFSMQVGLISDIIVSNKLVSVYHRHNQSAVTLANQSLLPIERYLNFYEKFALPFFYEKKEDKLFSKAFHISQRKAFKMLMQLIFQYKKNYYSIYKGLKTEKLLSDYKLFYQLFRVFPYKYISYLFDKVYGIFPPFSHHQQSKDTYEV